MDYFFAVIGMAAPPINVSIIPPSATIVDPFTYVAASLHKKAHGPAISLGVPHLPTGVR